jgi:hypothetical protein
MSKAPATFLTPANGFLFRITHIDNVRWILDHGLQCANSSTPDPEFRGIGSRDLIAKRRERSVPIPPGGTLTDYVPFYFTPYSPMLYKIQTGHEGFPRVPADEIIILMSAVSRLVEQELPFILTDRHAYLSAAVFSPDADGLERVDWDILRARNFSRSDDDPGRIERYQAEALVHRVVPLHALRGLACYSDEQRASVQMELTRRGLDLKVATKPDWYF